MLNCYYTTFLFQKTEFLKQVKDVEGEKRSGVGGLCIDYNYVYYSWVCNDKPFLCKIRHNGKFVCKIPLPKFVRGIGKDIHGYLYILCSSTSSKVLKFDNELNPVKKTSSQCGEYFGEAFGMLVTSEYVFVCAHVKQKICILDLDLTLHHLLEVEFNPIGITKLHNKYFVATRGAIQVMDINFDEKNFKVKKYEKMKSDGKMDNFIPKVELRGICADDNYLYVTERDESSGGRILCLDFDEKDFILKYFHKNCCADCTENKCCPIAIAHHNDMILYSQGSYAHKFHLLRLKYDGATVTSEKLIDVSW